VDNDPAEGAALQNAGIRGRPASLDRTPRRPCGAGSSPPPRTKQSPAGSRPRRARLETCPASR
jgi:hypothetical protein